LNPNAVNVVEQLDTGIHSTATWNRLLVHGNENTVALAAILLHMEALRGNGHAKRARLLELHALCWTSSFPHWN